MTQAASELLGGLAEQLPADLSASAAEVAESVRNIAPEIRNLTGDQATEDLVRTSITFLEILLRSLHPDSDVSWEERYASAREASRRYAEKGVHLESLMDGLAVYRRWVIERVSVAAAGSPLADEVVLLAQSRLGDVIEHINVNFVRGYLDYTEARHAARQNELHGLYHIASALGRSLDVTEIADLGLTETLRVLGLQAGALWVREGARLKLAKTVGLQPGQEEGFVESRRPGSVKGVEVTSRVAESRVDRISGEWNAIRAELRTKGVLLGAMALATQSPRKFESTDLEFVAAVADQIAVSLDRARQHTREARTDYLTGLANRPEFERAMDRAVAAAERHQRRLVLMMIDLDDLKRINDEHGHHVGDEAIQLLAQELQRAVRATDTCGRLGGDEFGIAMPDAEERHAAEVAARVRASLGELKRLAKIAVPVEFSIGIAAWKRGMDWQAMYEVADTALYAEKRHRHSGHKRVGEARS